ncbi:segregation and condensation protein B [Candidatus Termititenax persephonae]|uniref:Segregation and condensation protein B n=1 Tax=Candidatus Termititenax persephonae TaxID=2218525 RepID=A0A388TJ44_9BACT|nr:segregation and condensation protein B [Candidatus Termititenax persephonae]
MTDLTIATNNNLLPKLEVLLFLARQPLLPEQLARYLETSEEAVQQLITELTARYADPAHGLQIVNISDGYQFATKPEHARPLELYINTPQEFSLSTAAMETLTIIAYRQPISKPDIERIRGIDSGWIIKSLQEKELVEEKGQADTVGRPVLYATTEKFLRHFGLKNLQDLPPAPFLKMRESQDIIVEKLESPAVPEPEVAVSGGAEAAAEN